MSISEKYRFDICQSCEAIDVASVSLWKPSILHMSISEKYESGICQFLKTMDLVCAYQSCKTMDLLYISLWKLWIWYLSFTGNQVSDICQTLKAMDLASVCLVKLWLWVSVTLMNLWIRYILVMWKYRSDICQSLETEYLTFVYLWKLWIWQIPISENYGSYMYISVLWNYGSSSCLSCKAMDLPLVQIMPVPMLHISSLDYTDVKDSLKWDPTCQSILSSFYMTMLDHTQASGQGKQSLHLGGQLYSMLHTYQI